MAAEFLTFGAEGTLTRAASLAEQELSLLWGFKGELTSLRDSLFKLEAMLRDAQHLQVRGERVEMWVKDLEGIAHEADDVLDEYEYELLRRKVEIQNQIKKKVLNFFSRHNPIAFRCKMAHKIKNINASLANLKNEAASIGLVDRSTLVNATSHDIGGLDRETVSNFNQDEKYIVGRKEVASDIVTTLINSGKNQENCLSVMAIVGMGGLGKTTLAKSIYNDPEIGRHFDQKIWVCVSTPFEVKKILSEILECLKPEKAGIKGKATICENLQEDLKGKTYLLVLDDVWNEDPNKWDDLMSCLLNATSTKASKILVTTRKASVSSIVQTLPTCGLRKLSEDQCWRILKYKAFPDASAVLSEDQERIGREIAKKCAGVPLVAKDFDISYKNGPSSSRKNELHKYLDEERLDRKQDIDVLSWWQMERFHYPILSHLARDVLTIPISTVASESAFSVGGRVLDQYRSSLLPEIVQALLCTRDWLFGKGAMEEEIEILTEDVFKLNCEDTRSGQCSNSISLDD